MKRLKPYVRRAAANTAAICRDAVHRLLNLLTARVYFAKSLTRVTGSAIIFLPYRQSLLCCGLAGIVAYQKFDSAVEPVDMAALEQIVRQVDAHSLLACSRNGLCFESDYLGGAEEIARLQQAVRNLKRPLPFYHLHSDSETINALKYLANRLAELSKIEDRLLSEQMGRLSTTEFDIISGRTETLKDITWCISEEILANIDKIRILLQGSGDAVTSDTLQVFKNINSVLNSIDRLEVRGRDSAGISLMFFFDPAAAARFANAVSQHGLTRQVEARKDSNPLVNGGIRVQPVADNLTAVSFVYKVAAEIGSLGDNVRYLRQQIATDPILRAAADLPSRFHTASSHTRWASVGAITEANCHPVDNLTIGQPPEGRGTLHVCLNGDIDNYQTLLADCRSHGLQIHKDVTTDTKIIPLIIERHYRRTGDIASAFRLAVSDFKGSHAISMQTDLAPGKLFLAQKGSGQAIFIGLAKDHYMPTSEVYGFVEETQRYVKMDGEKAIEGKNGPTQGRIFILDQTTGGGVEGIQAMFYDGTPLKLGAADVKHTEITSRDIDRQDFPHFFLKEVSEAPLSVEKTLQNRWKLTGSDRQRFTVALDETTIPAPMQDALARTADTGGIRRIYFVGQGTAGVAARAIADIFNYYMNDPSLLVSALKASELSGFKLESSDHHRSMADTLVVPISQSGTTTDTNRTVDMVRERGARTLAIVNRRDSDITFKVDGVMYTSSGRDIEMSVASTKAFYSQIVAGALLGLYMAQVRGRRDADFVSEEVRRLRELPDQMRAVLSQKEKIESSARRLAVTKTYWAAVGSGPNKAAADEIRIKLSELCYKTISSDFIEDKKHIDLSSEPLIIVCAAGARDTVIGDIVKDTAIFQAHKATPVVICDWGENRFDPYAVDVLHVPPAAEHFAPILNTLVGHLWGYYGALAINEGSRFIHRFREKIRATVENHAAKGLDVYELILEKSFRQQIAAFYIDFRRMRAQKRIPTTMGFETASDLILLTKYLTGRLPVQDFKLDFGVKGTASNMLNRLFACLTKLINSMSRPVDAIKHQAKTVTVGTSRIEEALEGILFESLAARNLSVSQLTPSNILVLKNLQQIVSGIRGSITYRIDGLDVLGEPTQETTIKVIHKDGILADIPSRVETDTLLKGTKRIIARTGNVYIGKGRKDDRSILVIPVLSADPAAPNRIAHLLLLNITFKETVPLSSKMKALGGKFEHIKNIVQENSILWEDDYLEIVRMEELFGLSAEKIGEMIVSRNQDRDL